MSCGAVIVAGGASRRMGRDKAWLELGDEALLTRVAAVVASACDPVWVVGAPARALPPLPEAVRVIVDPPGRAGQGPLAAVLTGLEQLDAAGVSIAYLGAVDTPRLDARHVRAVVAHLEGGVADAVLPVTGLGPAARRHPLAAAVRVGPATRHAARLVAGGERRLRLLFSAPLVVTELGAVDLPSPQALETCNTPADWERATGEG